ncbi:unnamed protein product, partial [Pylaiella littoralis]
STRILEPASTRRRRFGPKCWRARHTTPPSYRKDKPQCSPFRTWPRDRPVTRTMRRTVVAACAARCPMRSLRKMKHPIRPCSVPHRCIPSTVL